MAVRRSENRILALSEAVRSAASKLHRFVPHQPMSGESVNHVNHVNPITGGPCSVEKSIAIDFSADPDGNCC